MVYYRKNKKRILECDKIYYTVNKNRILEQKKEYGIIHKERIQKYAKKYRYINREKNILYLREYRRLLKLEILNYYSNNTMSCKFCGFSDIRALTIDHIHGGGSKHNKEIGGNLYRWLKKNNFPDGFQVLCGNCNHSKENKLKKHNIFKYVGYEQKTKFDTFNHYSRGTLSCLWCGDKDIDHLTIDHIEGNGNKHRKISGCGSGTSLYYWLKRNNYPPGFQVLCMNCQMIKRIENNEDARDKHNIYKRL